MMKGVLCYAVGVAEGVTVRRVLAVLMALAALVLLPAPVYAQPIISAVTPATGPATGGTQVTITGAGFVSGASVVFGTTFSPQVIVTNSNVLVATTPAGAAGNASIIVVNPDGTAATTSLSFLYAAGTTTGVTITGLNPVPNGASVNVYISGTGFLPNPTVTVGGVAIGSVGLVSSGLILAVVPLGAGTSTATVTNTDGTSATYPAGSISTPGTQPVVTSVSPQTGSPAGGALVTITGSGFFAPASVMFGGQPATSVSVINSSMITAVTPANAAGPVTVLVSGPAGSVGGLNAAFNYMLTPPVLAALLPNTGVASGGTTFTLTGTGFVAGATVTVGGLAASNVIVVSPTQIVATTPPGTIGAAVVLVTNPGGLISGLATGFTYAAVGTAPPVSTGTGIAITSVSPTSGPVGAATLVTITGQGFVAGAIVTIGGLPATNVTVISSTQILASAPTGATAGAALVVVSNVGAAGAALPSGFTFTAPGTPTPLAPPATGGTLPPGSSGLMVFRGGSSADLVAASGCPSSRVVLWATNAQGQWVGYIPTAPSVINLSWDVLFPNGLAAGTPVYVRCS